MSKILDPYGQPSVTCGFYNRLVTDPKDHRKYDAMAMSSIFDGVITDGVFLTVDDGLVVSPGGGNTVYVSKGKCWFNHTWTRNDAVLPIDCGRSHDSYDRIDAIVVEINNTESVRDNSIKLLTGTAASSPVKPILINNDDIHQYALCYIYRKAKSTEITDADIENAVTSGETPTVTALLNTIDPTTFFEQWRAKMDKLVADETAEMDDFTDAMETDFEVWFDEMKALMRSAIAETNTWTDNQKQFIMNWFNQLKSVINTNAAINLQLQIDKAEIEHLLTVGLSDGTKEFSDDGTIITSVDSSGRKLVKTFANNFLTSTSVLTDTATGGELGRLVKEFSSDGKTISSTITII